ncbi:MAG: rod shape-determining protein MreC [Arenicellales bacterium]|jgi:rod shape-determining protein MreC|nr:rod shape-determining protein MreC [Arenicellales bacterium]MDP7155436.1 rod shape-determining protein MreC [Arenicellales bacterium]MDP7283637.1 rod shape-determining protein MreC [Arenicellales bacterium]MDP7481235.1 rod shape-determining protein MreC [Arenicellales bacterium]MEE1539765.1 rod shape-determining protein MreC [Arenicellales bacterium]|tara:strand:- start:2354 stop:3223 length:870 start_codon:yes stop_codon:yes gene_type:complete
MTLYRSKSNLIGLILMLWLSLGLMILDHRTQSLQILRSSVAVALQPLQLLAQFPGRFSDWLSETTATTSALRAVNTQLKAENQILKSRLQLFETLEAENRQLSSMLAASERVADEVLLAQLIDVGLEPLSRMLLIDKGSSDGVYVGQPVIDSEGVVGQVSRITPFTSAVTLVTDPNHALPVQIQRTGLRTVIFGTGDSNQLRAPYIGRNADLNEDDIFVTSGLGGRFPGGYPVAGIDRIIRDRNAAFLDVLAKPHARLDRRRNVLLIWPGKPQEKEPAISGETGERSDG